MDEIRAYAKACGLHPSTVVQRSGCGGGLTWKKWQSGGSCSMRTADRLRQWMLDNPAPVKNEDAA